LGELLWYLTRRSDLGFIEYYIPRYVKESEDGSTVFGGYGERMFAYGGINQVANVLTLLRARPDSRRAVIQVFGADDLSKTRKTVPCTCTLQFLIRQGQLEMFVTMRSNDAYLGLPHDVFAFTMLQEIMACSLGCKLGKYSHAVGSLHLYEQNRADAEVYLDEGFQSTTIAMPSMPTVDPWRSIANVMSVEQSVRNGSFPVFAQLDIDEYWRDICRLLVIYKLSKFRKADEILELKEQMHSSVFDMYIDQRFENAQQPQVGPVQVPMEFNLEIGTGS